MPKYLQMYLYIANFGVVQKKPFTIKG